MIHIFRAVLLAVIFLQGTAYADSISGRVVGVMDGDTIEILDAGKSLHRIRLSGIDAPEKAQPFGQRSKEHLSSLVFGKQVTVETGKTDRYSRTIGKIVVNGVDANLSQINAGMAWHYKQYEKDQPQADRISYASAERQARNLQIGLWADKSPTPPWEWRHGGTQQHSVADNTGECPCGSTRQCTGPKGGVYCLNQNGKKKY